MIKLGAQSGFLAFQTDEADPRVWYQLQDGIEHAQSGAQDRDEHHFAFAAGNRARCQRGLTETGPTANERVAS